MNFLSEQEKIRLKTQDKKEREKRVCDRIKGVLLSDEGWTPQQIAKVLLISDQAVRDHVEDYKSLSKLQPKSGGSIEKLSKEQSEQLEVHLQKHTYLYVKDMMAYIEIEFGVKYIVPEIRNWLQRHSFSYKKPSIVPGKSNKEQKKKWLKEYEELREKLSTGETICFIDGVYPTHHGQFLIQEDKTLNGESTIQFFQKIEKAYPDKEKIHVFCDNAPYYRNKKVKKYLEQSRIVLHFLLPDSPNLNPIERLWKWMKERIIYNTYYEHFEEFKRAIMEFFALLSTLGADSPLGQELRSKVRDKFRSIGAPAANI